MSKKLDLTKLLLKWSEGNRDAMEQLTQLVQEDLKIIAAKHLRAERALFGHVVHSLQPTTLVGELFCRLLKADEITWENRAQFFGFCSHLMRNILVDYARTNKTERRGFLVNILPLSEEINQTVSQNVELLILDGALWELEKIDPRKNKILELIIFTGLTMEEVAEVLGFSTITIKREWKSAKAWLNRYLDRIASQ